MILSRIAGDRALRSVSLWIVAASLNTSVMAGLILWRSVRHGGEIPIGWMVGVAWLGVAVYLAFGQVRTRCSGLDLSLPIPTRTIWAAHMLAVLIAGGVIVAVSFISLILNWILLAGLDSVEPGPLLFSLLLLAGFVLAALLVQLPRRSLASIPITPGYAVWVAGVLIGVPLLIVVASGAGFVGLFLIALLATAIGGWMYRTVPPSFIIVPLEPGRADRPIEDGEAPPAAGRGRWTYALTLAGGVSAGAQELMVLPLIVIFGMILGGGLNAISLDSLREMQFLYLPMIVYMLFVVIGPRLGRLHQLDALPISRRTLCMTLLAPYFVLLCAGYGLGTIVSAGVAAQTELVDFQQIDPRCETPPDCDYGVSAPLRVYSLAFDGKPPATQTSWGESHDPEALEPLGWGRTTIYSSYETPPGSSREFIAEQLHRAVQDVYGVAIPAGELSERYLVERQGRIVGKAEGLTLRADYPQLQPRRGPLFPAMIGLSAVPWLLLVAVLLRAYRAGVGEWVRQSIFWGSMVGLLVFWIGLSVASMIDWVAPWTVRGVVEIPVLLLGNSVLGTLSVWLISALAIFAAYRVAQWQFERMEIPSVPSKYSLLDRMRVDE